MTRPVLAEGSLVRDLYGEPVVQERHRHRYEVNNYYRTELEKAAWSALVFRPTAGCTCLAGSKPQLAGRTSA